MVQKNYLSQILIPAPPLDSRDCLQRLADLGLASEHLDRLSCPFVPIRPQHRIRRTVPNRFLSIMRL